MKVNSIIPGNINVMEVISISGYLDRHDIPYEVEEGIITLAEGKVKVKCYNEKDPKFKEGLYFVTSFGKDEYLDIDSLKKMLDRF